jgi:hypothetical protein
MKRMALGRRRRDIATEPGQQDRELRGAWPQAGRRQQDDRALGARRAAFTSFGARLLALFLHALLPGARACNLCASPAAMIKDLESFPASV